MATDPLKSDGQPGVADTDKYVSVNSLNIYDFMDDAYLGSRGFRDGKYLVPHSREMFYKNRMDLAFYKNFVRPIIRAMVDPVFVNLAPRTVTPDNVLFTDFIDNCDNAGTHLQDFSHDVIETCRLHGCDFVVVDDFPMSEQPDTAEEAKIKRIFPYVYERTAQQVYEYKVDGFGNLESITFKEEPIKKKVAGKEKEVDQYRKWTKNQVITLEMDSAGKSLVPINTIDHNLEKIPVISIYSGRRRDKSALLVDPPLYDLAKLNLTIFNKDSEIREVERNQGFSVLYIQGRPTGNVTTGTSNVLFISPDATIPPGFAAPNPQIQDKLMQNNDKIKEDLFRIAEQSGVTGVRSAKSGIAVQWDFYAHESVLKRTSWLAGTLEEKIAYIFALYTKETFEYVISYPQNFQPNDKLAEVNVYDKYLGFDLPSKAKKLAKKKITRVLFSDESEEEVADALKEIDEEEEDETFGNESDRRTREMEEGIGDDQENESNSEEGIE